MRSNYIRLSISFLLALLVCGTLVCWLDGRTAHVSHAAGPRYVATMGDDTGNDCVNSNAPCATVQHAVDVAETGDEIRIAAGTYMGVSVRGGTSQVVYVSQTVTIRGGYTTTDSFAASDPVATPTILDAQGLGRVVFITETTGTLENLTVQNGNISSVGAVCPIAGCGGGVYAGDMLTFTNVYVANNTARRDGGGVYAVGKTIVNGSIFTNNRCSFPSCYGGGLAVLDALALTGTQFISNAGGYGGGLHAFGALNMEDTQFISNTARYFGGGARVTGGATISKSLFIGNASVATGGGLSAPTMLTMTNSQFMSNTSGDNGGGLFIFTATLNGGLFLNNNAYVGGGMATGGFKLWLTGTQFIGNMAYLGGGILDSNNGNDRVVNALFARNAASGTGGGLYVDGRLPNTSLDILHTTITSPTIGAGAAIAVLSGTVNLTNTIIASYTMGISRTNGTVNENYNLFFDVLTPTLDGVTSGGQSFVGDPAFINPAADNYRLGVTSMAIDKGTDVGVTADFEGDTRPQGHAPDIGYDESPFPADCYATADDGNTIFSSTNADAVQQAIDAASADAVVKVAGYCVGVSVRGNTTQTVYITKPLTLRGGYTPTNWLTSFLTQPTILDAQGLGRVVFIAGVVGTLENLTMQNGNVVGDNGFVCPSAGCGGGIYADSNLILKNANVISSTSRWYGGGAYVGGVTGLSGGLVRNNQCTFAITNTGCHGGGLYARSQLTLVNTQFVSNTASGYSTTTSHGGGIYAFRAAIVDGAAFRGNRADNGGGIYAYDFLILTNSNFISNTARWGGGVFALRSLTVTGGTFQSNNATDLFGGGIYANENLVLSDAYFLTNAARQRGGGVRAYTAATINSSVFQGNQCFEANCQGGGLAANGLLLMMGTQFISNTSAGDGGGLYVSYNAPAANRVVNALFARNIASGNGSGIFMSGMDPDRVLAMSGSLNILHTTIASPTIGAGAAIAVFSGTVNLTNTIIASYTMGISNTNGVVNEDYNLLFGNLTDRVDVTTGTHSFNGNPFFVSPAGDDYRLTARSLAIERGTNLGVMTDFENQVRPQGNAPDIGYDESPFTIQANLSIQKRVMSNVVPIGQAITYMIVYTNEGPQPVSNVWLTDMFPLSVISSTFTSQGTLITPTGNLSYTWQVADLAAGAGGLITITGFISNDATLAGVVFTNTATITTTSLEINSADNASAMSVTIVDAPILGLVVSASNLTAVVGNLLTFTASITSGTNVIYQWNFGDGNVPAGITATHTYTLARSYPITLTASNGVSFITRTLLVTITAVNTPPNLSALANVTTTMGAPVGPLSFSVNDLETPASALTITISSSNNVLVPLSGIIISGSGISRTLTITPTMGQIGTTNITITVTDIADASTNRTFVLMVTDVKIYLPFVIR